MNEPRRLARQLLLLAVRDARIVQLPRGVGEVVAALGERCERADDALVLALRLAQRSQRLGVAGTLGIEVGEPVERDERSALAQQALVFVLAVEIGEDLAQLP